MPISLHILPPLCAATTALALAGAAPAQPPSTGGPGPGAQACFFPREINSWREAGREAVVLRLTGGRYYRLQLMGPCPELRSTMTLGIDNRGGSSICTGEAFSLIVRDLSGQGTQHCPVTGMVPVTREEGEAALGRR
ncbi:MAG TPA: DUF6491 family protein [Caulobacteraceae bacterium]|jgi:hypothetical protein